MFPSPVLPLPIPDHSAAAPPVDLQLLLHRALAEPTFTDLSCHIGCSMDLLQCTLEQLPGRVQIVDLSRSSDRSAARVHEPVVGDPIWGGRRVVAALTRQPGHWVTYLCRRQVWWRVDSVGRGVQQRSPFQDQSQGLSINFLALM